MIFNKHLELDGKHAFLSASKYHWINYDDEKISMAYLKYLATQKGTELHEFAENAIRLGIKLPKNKNTLNMYVNDAIGFRMKTEQALVYSENAFGTADAISFNKNFLRIHDLKTGNIPCSMNQLEVYASLFCLEYGYNPNDIDMELRIYQNNEIIVHDPNREDIIRIIDKIVTFDKIIKTIKLEAGS